CPTIPAKPALGRTSSCEESSSSSLLETPGPNRAFSSCASESEGSMKSTGNPFALALTMLRRSVLIVVGPLSSFHVECGTRSNCGQAQIGPVCALYRDAWGLFWGKEYPLKVSES